MYDILIRVLILSDVRPVTKEVPSPPGIITREPCMLPAVATLTAGLYRWAIDAPHLAQTVWCHIKQEDVVKEMIYRKNMNVSSNKLIYWRGHNNSHNSTEQLGF